MPKKGKPARDIEPAAMDQNGRESGDRADSGAEAVAQLAALKNLGPTTACRLGSVGICSPEKLRAVGAVPAFRALKARYPGYITSLTLYALEGAITGTPARNLDPTTRARLKKAVASLAGDPATKDGAAWK